MGSLALATNEAIATLPRLRYGNRLLEPLTQLSFGPIVITLFFSELNRSRRIIIALH